MEIYAISSETPEDSQALRRRLGAGYNFLSDTDGKVLDLFGIRHHQINPKGRDIAMPTMILVDVGGTIRWIYQTGDYRVRARPEQILRVLDKIQQAN